ncbi:MAG: hypothetical protein E7167_05595 [Firmicutes bacterium]|nr:hypothetical protein [Bacillota bacterium]
MEKLILGQKTMKVDAKGRMFIPSSMDVWKGSEVAFARFSGDYYHLYILEKINSLIDELTKKRDFAVNEEEFKLIVAKLNSLFDMIIDVSKIDAQRRILLPSEIQEKSSGNVILQGKGDCIALFPNEDIYENYRTLNLSKDIRI